MKTPIKLHTKVEKKPTLYLRDNLKKIWINISTAKKMQDIIDDTYYNLCALRLYGDIFYNLQNLHHLMDTLLDDEYLDEDEIATIYTFYENNYK